MANVLVVLAVVAGAIVWLRHIQMRWQNGSFVDAAVSAARRVWPAKPITWAQLDQRIWRRICASLEPGVSGKIIVPSTFVVWLSTDDITLIGEARPLAEINFAHELRKRAGAKRWQIASGPVVAIRHDADAFNGMPRVEHWYHGESNLPAEDPFLAKDHSPGVRAASQSPSLVSVRDTLIDTVVEGRRDAHRDLETVPDSSCRLAGADGISIVLSPFRRRFSLGRAADVDIPVRNGLVSAHHALLRWNEGSWMLEDAGSRNGTFLNDLVIDPGPSGATRLADGDRVRLGRTGPVFNFSRSVVEVTGPAQVCAQ